MEIGIPLRGKSPAIRSQDRCLARWWRPGGSVGLTDRGGGHTQPTAGRQRLKRSKVLSKAHVIVFGREAKRKRWKSTKVEEILTDEDDHKGWNIPMDVGAWRRWWAARGLFASRNGKGVACKPEQAAELGQREPLRAEERGRISSLRSREVKARRRKLFGAESA